MDPARGRRGRRGRGRAAVLMKQAAARDKRKSLRPSVSFSLFPFSPSHLDLHIIFSFLFSLSDVFSSQLCIARFQTIDVPSSTGTFKHTHEGLRFGEWVRPVKPPNNHTCKNVTSFFFVFAVLFFLFALLCQNVVRSKMEKKYSNIHMKSPNQEKQNI